MLESQAQIERTEGTFRGAGGLSLYYQSSHLSSPERVEPRGIAVIVHGLGAHSGLFDSLVRPLTAKNYLIYEFDLRGHGKSPGQRGFIRHWSEFRTDLAAFIELIASQHPQIPCFLIGHSLGSIIALDYLLHFRESVRGIVALSPPLGDIGAPPFRIFLARLLSRVWPRFALSTGFDWAASSRDLEAIAVASQDPLRHDKATARLATEFFETLERLRNPPLELKVPLLILHGSCDRVALPEGSRLFFESIRCADKEMREYPGAYHEMHNDLNAAETAADLVNWLERHLD